MKIKVKIDITGFYYRPGPVEVEVEKGSTVVQALMAARQRDIDAYLRWQQQQPDGSQPPPMLDFSLETGPSSGLFINELVVRHTARPISGQDPNRSYEPGKYAYADDPVKLVTDSTHGARLARDDDSGLPYVLAWQYYLYDDAGRDLARVPGNGPRKVEPASAKTLEQDTTIVWRLVAIFLEPTDGSGIKATLRR